MKQDQDHLSAPGGDVMQGDASQVKERPILFSAPMVSAILAGTKSQTRRAWRNQPPAGVRVGRVPGVTKQPYGWPGDRLWVRETFALEHQVEGDQTPPFADGRPIKRDDEGRWLQPHYRATDPTPELAYEDGDGEPTVRWKPSIHIPRWASRILLEITDVRAQRLQDISETDAIAEGIVAVKVMGERRFAYEDGISFLTAVDAYRHLWDAINGDGAWDANPMCWAVSFCRIQPLDLK